MKNYTILTVKHQSGVLNDWSYLTSAVKNNGGLCNHIKDVERCYNVEVIGHTQYTPTSKEYLK